MLSFKNRSVQYELLDEVDNIITSNDLYKNLKELDFINTYLGGHVLNVKALESILKNFKKTSVIIAEIGCGGGDNLRHLSKYFANKNKKVQFVGIDLKRDCIAYANANNALSNINYFCSAYQHYVFVEKPDIIFSSLFCHHFSESQIQEQLQWMHANSTFAFFINDLQRNAVAYYSIKTLTKIFSKSYLVKHDAPLSVLRAYTKKEWLALCKQTNIAVQINWKWAFRFLIIGIK